MVVLIIQMKCLLKSFLKPNWGLYGYCSNISQIRLPVPQHLSPNQPRNLREVFIQKHATTLHSYNWTASYHSPREGDEVCRVNLGDAFSSQPPGKASFPHLPNPKGGTTIRKERKRFFLSLLLGFIKDWTKNKLVTEWNLKAAETRRDACLLVC